MCALLSSCAVPHAHHEEGHELGGPVAVETPPYQRMYEFHGHVGPYVVLGLRAGMLAREALGSPGYFDLTAEAVCPLRTPTSCFLDGLQLGSGCTLGKRNLTAAEGLPIGCLFTSAGGGRVRIVLAEGLTERLRAWIEADGVEETGRRVMGMPDEALFTVQRP